jgi:hypothetical protein
MRYEIHELVRRRLQEEAVPMEVYPARDRDLVAIRLQQTGQDKEKAKIRILEGWGVVFGLLPHFFCFYLKRLRMATFSQVNVCLSSEKEYFLAWSPIVMYLSLRLHDPVVVVFPD